MGEKVSNNINNTNISILYRIDIISKNKLNVMNKVKIVEINIKVKIRLNKANIKAKKKLVQELLQILTLI